MTFQFDSLAEFISMSGHGRYVWAAYGITFAAVIGLVVFHLQARKNFFKQQRSIAKRSNNGAAKDVESSVTNTSASP